MTAIGFMLVVLGILAQKSQLWYLANLLLGLGAVLLGLGIAAFLWRTMP